MTEPVTKTCSTLISFFMAFLAMPQLAAVAGVVTIDTDLSLTKASVNPATIGGNGNADGDPNGIPDSDEVAVVGYILAEVTRHNHDLMHTAYRANRAQITDLANPTFDTILGETLALYVTLVNAGTWVRAHKLATAPRVILNS